jgi:Uma2 family endonuclease
MASGHSVSTLQSSRPPSMNWPSVFTMEEYLALEEHSLINHEYDNGKRIPMPGGSPLHSKIKARVATVLNNTSDQLNASWEVFNSNIRIYLPAFQKALMPDAAVVVGNAIFSTEKPVGLLLNPTLIVEVLSSSTENYDRSEKFKYYRSLPSFKEYVLISQSGPRVETFVKKDNRWLLHEDVEGLDATVELVTGETKVLLSDLYRNIAFPIEVKKKRTK